MGIIKIDQRLETCVFVKKAKKGFSSTIRESRRQQLQSNAFEDNARFCKTACLPRKIFSCKNSKRIDNSSSRSVTVQRYPLQAPYGLSCVARARNLPTKSAASFPTLEEKSIMNCCQPSIAKRSLTTFERRNQNHPLEELGLTWGEAQVKAQGRVEWQNLIAALCSSPGVLLGILGGGVPPGSSNPDPISDQKCNFPHPFSDQKSKIHTRFNTRPLGRNYVITTQIRAQTKKFQNHFEFAYLSLISFYSFGIETINTFKHSVVPSKSIPDSRPEWAKRISVFRPNRRKSPTRWGGTYIYGLGSTPRVSLSSKQSES